MTAAGTQQPGADAEAEVTNVRSVGDRSPIAKAFDTLELLAEESMTPAELARRLRMDRSSALRLLRQLTATGYVTREETTRRYLLVGSRFLALASGPPGRANLTELVDPILREVRTQYGEAAMFALPTHDAMVYASFYPSQHVLGVREHPGAARPLHCSSVGKAYLSGLDDTALDQVLARMTFRGGTVHASQDRPSLYLQVLEAREKGYALDRDETSLGVSCVAVPLWIGESLVGAIGVTGPSTRLTDEIVERLGPDLHKAAARLHRQLG